MDAIRKIVNSDKLISIVDIPESLQNRQVELIILPVEERAQKKPRGKSSYGILKKYADPALIAAENDAWSKAVKEKHEKAIKTLSASK